MLITTCYKRKRRDEKEIRFGWRRSRRRVSGLPLRGKLLSFLKLLQCSLEISDKLCIFYFLTRLKYQSWRITIRSIILYITYKIVRPNWEIERERRTLTEISWSESLKALSLAEVSLTNCSIRCLVVCLKILKTKKKWDGDRERNEWKRERERTDSFWRWRGVSLAVPMASTRRRKAEAAVLIWKMAAATACDGLCGCDRPLTDDDGFCKSWKLIFFFLF